MNNRFALPLALLFAIVAATIVNAVEPQLLAHWKLAGDARDSSGQGLDLTPHGVDFSVSGPGGKESSAAAFDGRNDYLELPAGKLNLGTDDFTLSSWVHTEAELDDVIGDLVSQFDPATRTGLNLSIQNLAGVTTSQPNHRQLHFGIDQGRIEDRWTDHGRLGHAVFVFALAVHDDRLYAATCEAGQDQRGHVFRWEEGDRWTDLGSPDACNAVSSLASFHGSLYAATSKYRLAGSSLAESENSNLGGKIFRLDDQGKWEHVGTLPEVEAIGSLCEFRGKLYASSLYRPGGLFRMDGKNDWAPCGTPDGKRVEALAVYNGHLWATGYDEAGIYRYDGTRWEHMGKAGEGTQTYGLAVHRGELYVSQWPQARVFRYGGGTKWLDVGRLGEELESMPLVVYNGKLYGGTLPLAEVYRFDGDGQWTRIGRLDHTPDVKYRRAWSMAVYRGRLFCGTLPSGRVHSIEAGKNVTLDRELAPGWRHIAAVRRAGKLELFVDGKLTASSTLFDPSQYDLTSAQPFRIGIGANDYFRGTLADVRLYRGGLTAEAIAQQFATRR
ncbi:MAG TPA: LamG domain-containing protein [Pirellulaceae bacterium]|nr:LamG domain-containing protein [Pirellulaceae bacterium]